MYPYSDYWAYELKKSDVPEFRELGREKRKRWIFLFYVFFIANHLTWESTWADTFDVIRKKVLSDAQTHAYMTSIDDIMSWADYDWYNTGLNPVKPVSFTAGKVGFFKGTYSKPD